MLPVAIGSFLLLLLVAYMIARPIFAPDAPVEEAEGSKALAEKQRLLTDIRELDADYATGKLAESDYRELRARTMAEAAVAAQALEEAGRRSEGRRPSETATDQTATKGAGDGHVDGAGEDPLEREIAARKHAMADHGCPGCGAVSDPRDRFCRRCGAEQAIAGAR